MLFNGTTQKHILHHFLRIVQLQHSFGHANQIGPQFGVDEGGSVFSLDTPFFWASCLSTRLTSDCDTPNLTAISCCFAPDFDSLKISVLSASVNPFGP